MNALVMTYETARFVALAEPLFGFELRESVAAVEAGHDLDVILLAQGETTKEPQVNGQRAFSVIASGERVWFRSRANLGLTDLRRRIFFRLPKLVHHAGCEPWVRGIVTLDDEAQEAARQLAVWIDLPILASRMG